MALMFVSPWMVLALLDRAQRCECRACRRGGGNGHPPANPYGSRPSEQCV